MIENEIRILEIDPQKWMTMLEQMGAKKVGDWTQIRTIYDFHPAIKNKWIRLRTNGKTTTLTIKEILDKTKLDGTKELEIEVSDYQKTKDILKELGYEPRSIQENKRIRYVLGNVELDIDTWPLIPTYVEIEGKTKEDVEMFLQQISYSKEKCTSYDVESIYREFYHININDYPLLTFETKKEQE